MLARIQEETELQSLVPLQWPDRPAGIKCFLKTASCIYRRAPISMFVIRLTYLEG